MFVSYFSLNGAVVKKNNYVQLEKKNFKWTELTMKCWLKLKSTQYFSSFFYYSEDKTHNIYLFHSLI